MPGFTAGGTPAATRPLLAQQMLDHHLIEFLIVALRDQLLGFPFVERAGFCDQLRKGATAVVEVGQPMLDSGGAERMHVETNTFPMRSITVAFQRADLVERDAKIVAPKRLVLIELQAVLVVE